MNLSEAYKTLELSESASKDDVKKQFKLLAKKYHPDVSKEKDAESKFKKINEAYQRVLSGEPDHQEISEDFGFGGFGNPFGNQRQIRVQNIEIKKTITFEESVFGCKQHLSFKKNRKCNGCDGNGSFTLNNGCDKCGGRGQIHSQRGNMFMSSTCDKCHGRMKKQKCTTCSGSGSIESDASIEVSIPGGTKSDSIFRLSGVGHFCGGFMGMEQNSDVFLFITVTPQEGMSLVENDVVSSIEISLLEALSGATKKVNTLDGEKEISILPLSKNKDEVLIPKLGVNKMGNHKIILNVKYPENISDLIIALNKENQNANINELHE